LILRKIHAILNSKEALGELLQSSFDGGAYMEKTMLIIIPKDEVRKKIAGNIESTSSNNVGPRCSCTACGSCRCTPCK
jgi:hypothetical protein